MVNREYKQTPLEIPPMIPPYVAGLAFLLSTFLSSFVAAYLALSPTLDKYLENSKIISLESVKSNGENNARENVALREAGIKYAKQLDDLLSKTQELSSTLSSCQITSAVCEKTSSDLRARVSNCESTLRKR